MRFLIAGGSGFLGTTLRERLARDGHEATRLTRGEPTSANESRWDPLHGRIDRAVVEDADVVVNLAGASFVRWPLTAAYKKAFTDSRVETTRTLAEAVAASRRKPAFLAQNGTSVYGDRGDEVLTEDSSVGDDETFLGEITKAWQAATRPASDAGARVCVMRTAPVLSKRGGAIQPLYYIFKAGVGGPAGDGRQYFATISLSDWVGAVMHLATHDTSQGLYNLAGPNTTTNAEFTEALGRMLHRPTRLRVPAGLLRTVLPELSPEMLSSFRVEPARLLAEGYRFQHPTLEDRLRAAFAS